MLCHLVGLLALAVRAGTVEHPRLSVRTELPVRISANDNKAPAGTPNGHLLKLRLVARTGTWYPDGAAAPGMSLPAFAEEGRAPSIPGPMIRVRAGTAVLLSLRNDLPNVTLTVHGLVSRGTAGPATRDSLQLASGATRTLRIQLNAPGTYFYWGTTMGRAIQDRTREDSQLSGAIIVDAAGEPQPADRVIVLGMLTDTAGRWFTVRKKMLTVMNGLSWPHTERLTYAMGDTVRWRLINATADMHPMHLHGFYYHVDSRGDGQGDTIYAKNARDKVVTDVMRPGTTMSMTWTPDRLGNWLFHCHLPAHFAARGSLGAPPSPTPTGEHGAMNHALQGMSGLVLGVIVQAGEAQTAAAPTNEGERRHLRLVVRSRVEGSFTHPNFEFALGDGGELSAPSGRENSAPPIVLTRLQPVSITVVNTLAEPTAIHWHGIELESYYDGVAGFSGSGQRLSPVIAPGDSFVARFTPPRAGTFIYHTHMDEERQQPAGLAGPIIVLNPGDHFDRTTDFAVVASTPRTGLDSAGAIPRVAWLNGSATPTPLQFQAGIHYRVRFINMTTGIPGLRFEVAQNGALIHWRPIAKDGADLSEARRITRVARQAVSIGETADMDIAPEQEGELLLTARLGDGTVVAELPVHVSAKKQ